MARNEKTVNGKDNPLRAEVGEFTDKEIQQLESLSALGLTQSQIAKFFRISRSTLKRRMKDFPPVYEAMQIGGIKAKMKVRSTIYQMATNGKNTAATMFWLKFYDRPDQNLDLDEDGTDTLIGSQLVAQELAAAVANMTPDEVAQELKNIALEERNGVYSLPMPKDD